MEKWALAQFAGDFATDLVSQNQDWAILLKL
jgi:hypothetical protein